MRRSLVLALFVVAAALPAQAEVLYVQPLANSSARISDYGQDLQFGFRMFDDFTLASSASIERVDWIGLWIDLTAPVPAPAPAPDVVTWDLGFFANGANAPGAPLLSQALPAAQVAATSLGIGGFTVGGQTYAANFYRYSALLPTPFAAAANTRYWFSPLSLSAEYHPTFAWLGAPLASGTGNDLSVQHTLGVNQVVTQTESIERDRNLLLQGTVPEPATLWLTGTGLAGLLVRRRRVR